MKIKLGHLDKVWFSHSKDISNCETKNWCNSGKSFINLICMLHQNVRKLRQHISDDSMQM